MQTEVQLRYVPRTHNIEPRDGVVLFRNRGAALLDIGYTAILAISGLLAELF